MKQQSGFTLIELVMVMVILGVLAAVAVPKFVDLTTDAGDASAQGFAGAISSASSLNYATSVARSSGTGVIAVAKDAECKTLAGSLLTTGVPADIIVAGTVGCDGAGTTSNACVVSHKKGTTGTTFPATVTCTK